jgi:hypothetical protein
VDAQLSEKVFGQMLRNGSRQRGALAPITDEGTVASVAGQTPEFCREFGRNWNLALMTGTTEVNPSPGVAYGDHI